ncbi:MAG: molybdate ABC transporter substrate-binding protein [Planctomycetaceae bacterium]|nr:molybdate ABC transporter substrate-binding protein [Planctomycetaceae bacterium]
MKTGFGILCAVAFALVLSSVPARAAEGGKLLIAAAASLRYSYDDKLIPMFKEQNPGVEIEATYDSSGKLQAQIENGLEADIFMSAAPKQMNALKDGGFIDADTIVDLLENRIVLIRPASKESPINGFYEVVNADMIAVGDPASVPAGQYAREVFTSLGIWDAVLAKASLGTNVTEVLNWVAEGSADVGVVYATDAATTDRVAVIAAAPAGSLKAPVLYPVAMLAKSASPELAKKFLAFLQTPEAIAVFEEYGFAAYKK